MHLGREEWLALFGKFKQSAFRLEVHQVYTMPREQPSIALFLAGEEKPEGHNSSWHAKIRRNVASGRIMTRAKVVRRPFTDYLRYQFAWSVPANVAAGEDYRIVDVTERTVGLPDQDYWLLDESTVVLLNYNQDGTMRNRELIEPGDIDQYLKWRDIALEESVPFGEYRA